MTEPRSASTAASAGHVRVIASSKTWMETAALDQLQSVSRLSGVTQVVGMPDLHPGKGAPIGFVAVTRGILYPHLAGNDIGCGMALFTTDIPVRRAKLDRWEKKLGGLDEPWEGDGRRWLAEHEAPAVFLSSLGTIGGGNHFAELQVFEQVDDPAGLEKLGIESDRVLLLVHSGSRGFGESILRRHTDRFGAEGLAAGAAEAADYLQGHDQALSWARGNRALIAQRLLSCLDATGRRVLDLCHNSIVIGRWRGESCWLHRKGAAPSDEGAVVIPGSRGAHTYLVEPEPDQEANASTLAHGAGRKWSRSQARGRLESRVTREKLKRTELGSRVICDDRDLLYEEAPRAYKDIDRVVGDLLEHRLVRVVAKLRPILTYKTRSKRKERAH